MLARSLSSRVPFITGALAITALASTAPAGLGDFFVLDNGLGAGLYRGQTGVNGSDALVGALPGQTWFDLAPGFDSSFVFAVRGNELVTLSTANGSQLTSVSPDRDFSSIATDTATSTVYAVVHGVAGTPQSAELITVDTATGQTTTVGQLGGGTDSLIFVGLGFDAFTGDLFLTVTGGDVFSIDANSGAASFIGSTGLLAPYDIDFNPSDGQMYITDAHHDQLLLVDRTDASVVPSTLYVESGLSTGLAFTIPAPGGVALITLAGLGAMRRRR